MNAKKNITGFISDMKPINFTGTFLKTVYLPHKSRSGNTELSETSIVELDPKNKNDVRALKRAAKEWAYMDKDGFSLNIYEDFIGQQLNLNKGFKKYFVITTQNDNYNNLDPDKILGLTEYRNKTTEENEIKWLQTNPTTNYSSKKEREYKNMGKQLVDYVKEVSDKPLFVQSYYKAMNFYEKQGFTPIDGCVGDMIYKEE